MKVKLVVGVVLASLVLMITSGCLLLKSKKDVAADTNEAVVVAQPEVAPVAPVAPVTVEAPVAK